jgi:alpha-1,3-mannosyl-glycoprotein beta-1,2-N-acetylglucosaminyltransferase
VSDNEIRVTQCGINDAFCFSSGLFFEKHLKFIKLSESAVQFSKKDLTYLLKDNYDKTFLSEVYQTPVVTFEELRRGIVNSKGPVRIQYNNRNQYKSAAKSLGIMDDFKVRRGSDKPIEFD